MASSLSLLENYKRELPLVALAFGDKDLGWIYEYCSLIKRLLDDLKLDARDPRFALTLTDSGLTSFTIGNRVVAEPGRHRTIRLMMPMDLDHEQFQSATILGYYTTEGLRDAKLVDVFLAVPYGIPGAYEPWKKACEAALLSACNSEKIVEVHPPGDRSAASVKELKAVVKPDNSSNRSLLSSPEPVQGSHIPVNKPATHSWLLYLLITNNVAWKQWMEWNDLGENAFHLN